jgi:kojibiose phosphorylase
MATAAQPESVEGIDPRICIRTETLSPVLERRLASQYALSNGCLGLRGTHEELPSWASPGFYLAGSYCPAPRELVPLHSLDHVLAHPERARPEQQDAYRTLNTLPNLPNPVAVRLQVGGQPVDLETAAVLSCERMLHMEEALLARRLVLRDAAGRLLVIDSERFVSWAHPHLLCFRYQVTPDDPRTPVNVQPFIDASVTNARGIRLFEVSAAREEAGGNLLCCRIADPSREIAIAQAYRTIREGAVTVLEVAVAAYADDREAAERLARQALAEGYTAQRAAHLRAVSATAERNRCLPDADTLSSQGFRFGCLHMDMALPQDNPSVSVPIKGLTGEGYRFMVFWDTDFHLFPYYLLTAPGQARNLLLYRYRLLDAARENARYWGYRGAQVPWETASSGEEETAPWLCLQEREIHISADVAYAVKLYDDLTDDAAFLVEHGAEIVLETARFYASRVAWNAADGCYDLREIGCPDQYHTLADNNAFINRMAQWNLAYAAELAADARLRAVCAKIRLTEEEAREFSDIARQLRQMTPTAEGIIEEFPGFFQLSPDLRGISECNCRHTQAVKQPDVLLLFQPFGDDYPPDVLRANWRYYAARTLHGSSLSLPGMALAATRVGLIDEAADYFQRAARVDLDDIHFNTDLGVHLSSYGVLWQTAVFGFGGLTLHRDGLLIAPRLPESWRGIDYTIQWRGCRVRVKVTHQKLCVQAGAENPRAVPITAEGSSFALLPGEEKTLPR